MTIKPNADTGVPRTAEVRTGPGGRGRQAGVRRKGAGIYLPILSIALPSDFRIDSHIRGSSVSAISARRSSRP
ncbi:hypothetical protein GCM10009535_35610 [Streptomyces thermocarboxydovorans]|uniref:Transposase n=1 Tax=Streptomyces thermocarboxydovorans TaxID=59298 RepID=A0ABN1HJ78_9ACTN